MASVVFFGIMFVCGVIALSILQTAVDRLAKPLRLKDDIVQALFIGAGALVTLPFVLSILAEARVSILASLIVGAVILFHAAAAFAYALLRLIFPRARVPLSKG